MIRPILFFMIAATLSTAYDASAQVGSNSQVDALKVVAKCTSPNAPGTPEGAECKCSAEGVRPTCHIGEDSVTCNDGESSSFVTCRWEEGFGGCVCVAIGTGSSSTEAGSVNQGTDYGTLGAGLEFMN